MEVLVLLIIIIIFYKSKIFKKGFNEDYLSLKSSKLYKHSSYCIKEKLIGLLLFNASPIKWRQLLRIIVL